MKTHTAQYLRDTLNHGVDFKLLWQHIAADLIVITEGLLIFALIVGIFYLVYRATCYYSRKLMEKLNWDPAIVNFVVYLLRYVFFGIGILTAADQVGIDITSLLAGVSVVGLAVSLAAKTEIENIVAGIALLVDKPFRVGDRVEIEGAIGRVVEISLRFVRIKTKENYVKVIPTSRMIHANITNKTENDYYVIFIFISVAYNTDLKKAKKLIMDVLESDERVMKKPKADAAVKELGESSIVLRVKFGIKQPLKEKAVKFEFTEKLRDVLMENGVDLTFPCRNIYIKEGRNELIRVLQNDEEQDEE
ncbi:MAG: mechanosensitive ion channel family protein [Firmicutes bacterium]|nr:mechanosensitive ion channel family protein [Bacillota bacterium]